VLPPVEPLVQSEHRWQRPKIEEGSNEDKLRKVRGMLNKLTIESFENLSDNILAIGIDSEPVLSGIIRLVFEKAISEAHFSTMYAVLCSKLSVKCPEFTGEDKQKVVSKDQFFFCNFSI
jgi:hypothetical protein